MYLNVKFSDSSTKVVPVTDDVTFTIKDSTNTIVDAFAFGGVSTIELKEGAAPVVVPDPVVEPGTALVAAVPVGSDAPTKIVITTDPSTVEDLPAELPVAPAEVPIGTPTVKIIPVTDAPTDVPPVVAAPVVDPPKESLVEKIEDKFKGKK